MAIRRRNDGRWEVYYRDPETGRQRSEYFGRGTEGMAAAWRRNEQLGLGGSRKAKKRQPEILFVDLAKTYVKAKAFNENSKKMLKIRLAANILPAIGHRPAMSLTDTDLDNYVRIRRTDGVKDSTIGRELTDVKAILNFSAGRKPPLIPWNPIRDFKKPAPDDEIIDPPTPAEARRLLKKASPHLVRAIKLSYYVGLRPGAVELLSLTWSDMDWRRQRLRVTSAAKGGPAFRWVPLHADFIEEMKTWSRADRNRGAIVHYRGRPIQSIKKAWSNAKAGAKITRRLRPYDFRHYFVTVALEGGADVKALSEIVGSSPRTLLKHYQHITTKQHRQAVQKIPKL